MYFQMISISISSYILPQFSRSKSRLFEKKGKEREGIAIAVFIHGQFLHGIGEIGIKNGNEISL